MCQYMAIDGHAQDWHLMHWGNLLNSGAALFTIEATAVTPEGRITPGCLGLWDKLMQTLGAFETIGPVLLGLRKPVHILQLGSSVREIVNMVSIAVVDAQGKKK